MRTVTKRDAAREIAKRLSREHGPMLVIRLSWRSEDRRTGTYAALPRYAYDQATDAPAPRASILKVAILESPIAPDDRYEFARAGEYTYVEEFRDGETYAPCAEPFADDDVKLAVAV